MTAPETTGRLRNAVAIFCGILHGQNLVYCVRSRSPPNAMSRTRIEPRLMEPCAKRTYIRGSDHRGVERLAVSICWWTYTGFTPNFFIHDVHELDLGFSEKNLEWRDDRWTEYTITMNWRCISCMHQGRGARISVRYSTKLVARVLSSM